MDKSVQSAKGIRYCVIVVHRGSLNREDFDIKLKQIFTQVYQNTSMVSLLKDKLMIKWFFLILSTEPGPSISQLQVCDYLSVTKLKLHLNLYDPALLVQLGPLVCKMLTENLGLPGLCHLELSMEDGSII